MSLSTVFHVGSRFAHRVGNRAIKIFGLGKTLSDTASSRWYLLLDCAPRILSFLCIRFVAVELFGVELFDSDTANAFSNSAIFVIAIMLAGVLEDYKESESFPADIAAQFDALSEKIELAALLQRASAADDREDGDGAGNNSSVTNGALVSRQEDNNSGSTRNKLDTKVLHQELLSLLETVLEFIAGVKDDTDVLGEVTTHGQYMAAVVHRADCGIEAGDIIEHYDSIRCTLLRMHVIKRTDFIPSGYSLMDLIVWVTMALTTLASYETRSTAYATVALSALQFFYVLALLRDIDDPFDYSPSKLLPIVELQEDEEGEKEDDGDGNAEKEEHGAGKDKGDGSSKQVSQRKSSAAGTGASPTSSDDDDKNPSINRASRADSPDSAADIEDLDEIVEGPKAVVSMQGVGSSAEIDQFPLLHVYARVARKAGVPMGRPPPPTVTVLPDGTLERPSVLFKKAASAAPASSPSKSARGASSAAAALGPVGRKAAASKSFVAAVRSSMSKAWTECDDLNGDWTSSRVSKVLAASPAKKEGKKAK